MSVIVGLDGGYQSDDIRWFTIDVSDPSGATVVNTLYTGWNQSGGDQYFAWDGIAATQNAGRANRWLSAIATENDDWTVPAPHRLELYLVDDAGVVVDSLFVLETGFFADKMPYAAKVFRWGSDNFVMVWAYDDATGTDAAFGVVVSTAGDVITTGDVTLITANIHAAWHFADASETEGGALVTTRNETAVVSKLVRTGLNFSVNATTTISIGSGYTNGIAFHGDDTYVVAYELNGAQHHVAAVVPGTGVISSAHTGHTGGSQRVSHSSGDYYGDHVMKHVGGYVSISYNGFNTFATTFQFDGSAITISSTLTAPPPSQNISGSLRTVKLATGWLTAYFDRYIWFSDDFGSVIAQGSFDYIERTFFYLSAQLPDAFGKCPPHLRLLQRTDVAKGRFEHVPVTDDCGKALRLMGRDVQQNLIPGNLPRTQPNSYP